MTRRRKATEATANPVAPAPLDDESKRKAALLINPASLGSLVASEFMSPGNEDLGAATIPALEQKIATATGGDMKDLEGMLVAQAYALNSVFTSLAAQASRFIATPKVLDGYLRLAMKAQAQSRASIEALAEMKNPKVIIARQANFAAGHQQVNNGIEAGATHAGNGQLLDQPHQPSLAAPEGGEVLGADAEGGALPVPRDAERPLSGTRG